MRTIYEPARDSSVAILAPSDLRSNLRHKLKTCANTFYSTCWRKSVTCDCPNSSTSYRFNPFPSFRMSQLNSKPNQSSTATEKSRQLETLTNGMSHPRYLSGFDMTVTFENSALKGLMPHPLQPQTGIGFFRRPKY